MKSLFTIIFFLSLSCKQKPSDSDRNIHDTAPPNIVLIFMDDMGYGDLSCYGAEGFNTPNLDQMAKDGIRFTDFHAATAVCSASRAALLTGCYPPRVSVHSAYFPNSKEGLNPEETTIAEIAREQGYATGLVGKWHLGDAEEMLPLAQGFNEYYGIPYSNDMWPVYYDGKPADSTNSSHLPWKINTPPLYIMEGNKKVKEVRNLEDQDMITTLYTDKAVDFIKRNKQKPFFLYLAHSMPHVPLEVSEKFKGKSEQGMYGDVMMELDWSVGEVLKALNENGLEKNTLVIFTSDNGPWLNYGNHAGSTGGLREGKGNMWEGGQRVPAIMKWPNKIDAGSESDELMLNIDILPTITRAINGKLPEVKIDGIDMLDAITAQGVSKRKYFYGYYNGNLIFVRQNNWKLYFPHSYNSYLNVEPGMDGYPGEYNRKTLEQPELYNLNVDIDEMDNVIDQNLQIAEKLLTLGHKVRKRLGDRLTKTEGDEVRPPGRVN